MKSLSKIRIALIQNKVFEIKEKTLENLKFDIQNAASKGNNF